MSFETYATFVLTSVIFMLIPGPTVMLVVSQALSAGRRSVIPLAAGVGFGDVVAMSLSFLGIGAVLSASASLFNLLKWAGAAYLIYLGFKAWKAPITNCDPGHEILAGRSQFMRAFFTTALNPKSILFFVAFLPQFVNQLSSVLPQFIMLGATYVFIGILNAGAYAMVASHLRTVLRSERTMRIFNRASGSVLVGAGVITAMARRN